MKTPIRSKGPRGFSLIELMIILAIIGIMASIAIPSFKGALVRAKRAERNLMFNGIYQSLLEYYNANNYMWSSIVGTSSSTIGTQNPVRSPFVSDQRPFDTTMAGWNTLALAPEGVMRYSYLINCTQDPTTAAMQIQSQGDIDEDGVVATHTINWTLDTKGTWSKGLDIDTPNTE